MQDRKSLFFEILSEEIPAQALLEACNAATSTAKTLLDEMEVSYQAVKAESASRRLSVLVEGVATESATQHIERRGPRVDAPEAALQGFLKSCQLDRKDLVERNGYLYAFLVQPGRPFIDQIPSFIERWAQRMPWPKTMYWALPGTSAKTAPWIRPVRSVLCLWGGQEVVFDLPGWGLTTGATTKGHRFLSKDSLTVRSYEHYCETLKENCVVVNNDERRRRLEQACQEALSSLHLTLQPDENLWREVTGLVDWPFVIVGRIEPQFMNLPEAVLITAMRVHQKYFSTRDEQGKLAPFFVAFSNVPDPSDHSIQKGFEKVLRARLSDAAFFYAEDLKHPIRSLRPKLDSIVFHDKLGSLGQKVERLAHIVPDLATCAELCKLDLVSHMVGEFDELQGKMGAHYALKQGEDPTVALAIEEHYKPSGAQDDIPSSPLGAQLAVLDRLDTLVGFLGIGLAPTGSKDPFALRRSALGILRIALKGVSLDLEKVLHDNQKAYSEQGVALTPDVDKKVVSFLYDRLSAYWKDQGFRYDIIQSVLSYGETSSQRLDFQDLERRVRILQDYLTDPLRAGFMAQFTRLSGLVKTVEDGDVSPELFTDASEQTFWQALEKVTPRFLTALQNNSYREAMDGLATLKEPFDAMLGQVHIHTDDAAISQNREALLTSLLKLYSQIADFSKIQVEVPV